LINDPGFVVRASKILFRARNANTLPVSIGRVGFTAGGAGMIAEVLKPGSGFSDFVLTESEANDLYPTQYAISPGTGGEGVYVTYWVR
jgi:hypothetical protein